MFLPEMNGGMVYCVCGGQYAIHRHEQPTGKNIAAQYKTNGAAHRPTKNREYTTSHLVNRLPNRYMPFAKGACMIDEIKVGLINSENIPHAVLIDRLNKLIRAQNAMELAQRPTPQGMPCPICKGLGVESINSDGLPNTCTVCHGTGTAPVA